MLILNQSMRLRGFIHPCKVLLEYYYYDYSAWHSGRAVHLFTYFPSQGLASRVFLKFKVPAARVFCSCGPVLYRALFCCQTMRSSASRNCSRILLRSHHLVTFLTPSAFVSRDCRVPKSKRPFILSCSLVSWCNGQKIVTCSGVSRSWPQAQAALFTSGTPTL